jgi:hypothetical protein
MLIIKYKASKALALAQLLAVHPRLKIVLVALQAPIVEGLALAGRRVKVPALQR